MSQSVPPSMFFGKKSTRGQTKYETERAATSGNQAKSNSSKENSYEVGLHRRVKNERNLRSTVEQNTRIVSESAKIPPDRTLLNLRSRKNAGLEKTQHKLNQSSVQTTKVLVPSSKTTSVKNVGTQPKNPVYKQAKSIVSPVPASLEDEYEFHVETPEGLKKKPKKRQPRLKNTIQTLWGFKVRPETKKRLKASSKVFVQVSGNVQVPKMTEPIIALPVAKKAPLQERTGNTLRPMVISDICHDSDHDNLFSSSDEKKKTDKSASKDNKCVSIQYKQSDGMKENRPFVEKSTLDTKGGKCFPFPLKKTALTASTPHKQSLSSPSPSHMSVVLSPVQGDRHVNQSMTSILRGNSIHTSTPVRYNISCKTADNKGSDKEILPGKCQRNIQMCIPTFEFDPCTVSVGEDKSPEQVLHSQHHSCNSATDVKDNLSISVVKYDVNEGEKLCRSADYKPTQGERPTFLKDRFTSEVPMCARQAYGPWRLGSTTRYNFDSKLNLDNCFGFDDDNICLEDISQFNQPIAPEVAGSLIEKRVCSQLEKNHCNQLQGKCVCQSQVGLHPQPEKQQFKSKKCSLPLTSSSQPHAQIPIHQKIPVLMEQMETTKKQILRMPVKWKEKPHGNERHLNASPPEQDIDNLLSSSLLKLRKKKADDSIFRSTSVDHLEPTLSSRLISGDSEDNMISKNTRNLFDDIEEGDTDKSLFSEPPRRSYACVRPSKRLIVEEETGHEDMGKDKPKPGPAKRNKTFGKRKKTVQTSLDRWAKELSSHFAEVDDTDLLTE